MILNKFIRHKNENQNNIFIHYVINQLHCASQTERNHRSGCEALALKECLTSHYRERTPADAFSAPAHDVSFLLERYALDNAGKWNAFQKFVAKETKGFGTLTLALHPDSAKDANNIMERCMSFYESEKLDNYIRNKIMK